MHPLIFLDTETTDLDGYIVEVSWAPAEGAHDLVNLSVHTMRVKPPRAIDLEAMAVHHITESMVANLPLLTDHPNQRALVHDLEEAIFVAHNAKFDIDVLKRENITPPSRVIDTQRVALKLYPDLPSYKLQYLRYYLKVDIDGHGTAHTAEGDVQVLIAVFRRLLWQIEETLKPGDDALQIMQKITEEPMILQYCTFPKHKGKTWREVNRTDRNYIEFMYRNAAKYDADVQATLKHWIAIRSE